MAVVQLVVATFVMANIVIFYLKFHNVHIPLLHVSRKGWVFGEGHKENNESGSTVSIAGVTADGTDAVLSSRSKTMQAIPASVIKGNQPQSLLEQFNHRNGMRTGGFMTSTLSSKKLFTTDAPTASAASAVTATTTTTTTNTGDSNSKYTSFRSATASSKDKDEDEDEITISDVITVDGVKKQSELSSTQIRSTFAPCECTDPDWCNLPIPSPHTPGSPTPSHYNMPDITNKKRWEHAKCLAARGDQVLLRRLLHFFPNPNNFLNGDGSYRHLQPQVDIFLNPEDSLKALIAPDNVDKHVSIGTGAPGTKLLEDSVRVQLQESIPPKDSIYQRMTRAPSSISASILTSGSTGSSTSSSSGSLLGVGGVRPGVPGAPGATIHYPIVSLGYPLLGRGPVVAGTSGTATGEKGSEDIDTRPYFVGPPSRKMGGFYLSKLKFLKMWNKNKHLIDTPFVAMYVNNENWGFLGTIFPNRTTNWEFCEAPEEWELKAHMHAFLDDPHTIALVVNQHHNFTHPKVITMPLGLPDGVDVPKAMFTAMHSSSSTDSAVGTGTGGGGIYSGRDRESFASGAATSDVAFTPRKNLLFVASSNWGPRPKIAECVRSKLRPGEFVSNVASFEARKRQGKSSRVDYYQSIASSKMGLSMPGLGYDTYRTWELLTLGAVVVTERGVGFDRTFSRLPVLLLDDFSHVNSELLRSAYVEALYHVNRFQFEKLTQSFWMYALRMLSRYGNHHRGAATTAATSSQQQQQQQLLLNPIITTYFPMSAQDTLFTRPLAYSPGHQEGLLPVEYTAGGRRKECELYPKTKRKHQQLSECLRFPKLLCDYNFSVNYLKS